MLFAAAVVLLLAGAIIWRVTLLALFWALWYTLTHLGIVTYVVAHPWQTAAYIAGYFLVGATWSVFKWYLSETNRVREAKERYARDYSSRGAANSMALQDFMKREKTNPNRHTDTILFWIGLWPLNMLFTLCNDPVRRIYIELQGVYQRITDSVWDRSTVSKL